MLTAPPLVAFAHTVRAVPTGALLAVAALTAAPAVITAARGGSDFSLALVAAAVLGGAGFAYAVDDDAAVVLAASPITLARRRAIRILVALLVVVIAWELVVAVAASADSFDHVPFADLAVEAFTAAGIAIAVATATTRRGSVEKNGIAGVGAAVLVMLMVTTMAQKYAWLPQVGQPQHHDRWLWIAAAAWAIAGYASRDPAHRSVSLASG